MQVTESWSDKTFEIKYTEKFFKTGEVLTLAQEIPTVENVKKAFALVKSITYDLIENSKYTSQFDGVIKPALDDIELVLFGDSNTPKCRALMRKYGVKYRRDDKRKTSGLTNIQNVLKELWEIYRLTKQWAYQLGFFVYKPHERRFGLQAIEDTMQM